MGKLWYLFKVSFPGTCNKRTLPLLCLLVAVVASVLLQNFVLVYINSLIFSSVTCAPAPGSPKADYEAQARDQASNTTANGVAILMPPGTYANTCFDLRQFITMSAFVVLVAALTIFMVTTAQFLSNRFGLKFRKQLMSYIHRIYFRNNGFYKTTLVPDLDCPDSRITTELDMMTKVIFGGVNPVYNSIFVILVMQLVSIPLSCAAAIGVMGNFALISVVYGFIFVALVSCVSAPLGRLTGAAQVAESFFKHLHNRINGNSESIAFFRGGKVELARVDAAFDVTSGPQRSLIWVSALSNALQQLGGNGTSTSNLQLPVFLVALAVPLFQGQVPVYTGQNYFLLSQLLSSIANGLVLVVGTFPVISQAAGYVDRVYTLVKAVEDSHIAADDRPDWSSLRAKPAIHVQDHPARLGASTLAYSTPTGHQLQKGLSFDVDRHTRLVIQGPSGCGKSSLLRVLGGLWEGQSGGLHRPMAIPTGTFFMPQRPYMPIGNLRDLLVYPVDPAECEVDDSSLKDYLQRVSLGYLLDRYTLDTKDVWEEALSGGEQQRVAFVRLFYHRPVFAIMDEGTSALDVSVEKQCMQECVDQEIGLISVAHRPTVLPYHNALLRLDNSGGFALEDISQQAVGKGEACSPRLDSL
jgi:ABC-type uncharacterized transport system fused permease/ATPase subunit